MSVGLIQTYTAVSLILKEEDFLFHVGTKEIPGAGKILELFSQQKTDFATENPLLIQDLISEADYKILLHKVS